MHPAGELGLRVVAPNFLAADKKSPKPGKSAVGRILRCHEPCEVDRTGALFDRSEPICEQRRTRWRRGGDSNPRSHKGSRDFESRRLNLTPEPLRSSSIYVCSAAVKLTDRSSALAGFASLC